MNTWILIPTYSYPEGLKETLKSLRRTPEPIQIKVILNGVDWDSYKWITEVPGIEILPLEHNLGYFKAMNRGTLSISAEDYVVHLNDDVIITDERWLSIMYERMTNPTVPSDQDPHTWSKNVGIVGYTQPMTQNPKVKTDRWLFSCCLLKPEAVRRTGLFDERYQWGFGEYDYLCRLHSNGFGIEMIDEPYILHEQRHTYRKVKIEESAEMLADAWFFHEAHRERGYEWERKMQDYPMDDILAEAKGFVSSHLLRAKFEERARLRNLMKDGSV